MAEGLAPFANKRAYIYRAGSDVAMREEILVPLGKILDREATDVALTADDVLYVPDSKGRRMTSNILERVTGFGASTASGVLIWRR